MICHICETVGKAAGQAHYFNDRMQVLFMVFHENKIMKLCFITCANTAQ